MYYIQVTITHEDNGYKYDYRTQKNNQDIQSIQEPRSWASPSPVNCSELVGCMTLYDRPDSWDGSLSS